MNTSTEKKILSLLTALILGACSSANVSKQARIEPGTRLSVTTDQAEGLNDRIDADEFFIDSAWSGATHGLAAGILLGLECGSAFVFCAPLFSTVGGAAGLMIGGMSASFKGANTEERQTLTRIQMTAFLTRSPSQYLEDAFVARAARRWKVVSEQADSSISLRFEELRFIQHSEDSFSLRLKGSMTVSNPKQRDDEEPLRMSFQHVTEERSLRFFLDPTGQRFMNAFEKGIDDLSLRMMYAL